MKEKRIHETWENTNTGAEHSNAVLDKHDMDRNQIIGTDNIQTV